MRDSNPHAREQLILSQPCLPFHQFPVNNMVGAARFELAMMLTCALVIIAPLCAGLCIPIPPSAYKVAFRSRTYWERWRPVSSSTRTSRSGLDMDYRIHQNASCLSQSQEKYSRFPARTSGIFISCLLWLVIVLNHSLSH